MIRMDFRTGSDTHDIVHYRLDTCMAVNDCLAHAQEKTPANGSPVVPLLHFEAREVMEQTLLRWIGNICATSDLTGIAGLRPYGMQGKACILEYDREVLLHFRNQVKGIDEFLLAGGFEGLQWARETIAVKNILNGLEIMPAGKRGVSGLLFRKAKAGEDFQLVNVFMLQPASQKLAG